MNIRLIASAIALSAAALAAAGCASEHNIAAQHTTPPAPAATTQAAPAPSPGGTGTGSCAYTLGDNPVGGTAVATGEVDLTSTGNIGAIVRVTINWPQEGFAPLSQTKTVQMPYNASAMPVEFSQPLTSTQLDNLQNWELGHMSASNDCTYNEEITGTYGSAHS